VNYLRTPSGIACANFPRFLQPEPGEFYSIWHCPARRQGRYETRCSAEPLGLVLAYGDEASSPPPMARPGGTHLGRGRPLNRLRGPYADVTSAPQEVV
jgi:hypothetical protein